MGKKLQLWVGLFSFALISSFSSAYAMGEDPQTIETQQTDSSTFTDPTFYDPTTIDSLEINNPTLTEPYFYDSITGDA